MTSKTYFSYLCACILTGCSSMSLQGSAYFPNDQLEISYKNFDNAFKKTRNKLLFNGDLVANDCNSYFELTSKYDVEESIHNQQVKSEYLICDALNILSNSSGIYSEKVSDLDLGEELSSKLDLRSFPSSLNRASDERSHTLKSLYPGQTTSIDNVVELQSEDWAFTMEVVALARINDNASPDWIVWVLDESKSGNYRGYSTLIVYDPEEQESFKAMTYPQS